MTNSILAGIPEPDADLPLAEMARDVLVRCTRTDEPVDALDALDALDAQEGPVAGVDRAPGELLKGREVLKESRAHDDVRRL
ncbi:MULTISPECIES: hypothetical protein [Streptomyces]|uniref:hypothetical protein n=1 Tax=Streptomyces TaxID=1883 RepID=UPI001682DA41|nr:hypothetical protein [Streptomyces venezuelae]